MHGLNVCDTLTFWLNKIFIRLGTKLYKQVVVIPMGTNCAPHVVDLFLSCYERNFMMFLLDDTLAVIIDFCFISFLYLDLYVLGGDALMS